MILSADEVVRFLEAVPSLKTRTALTTAYAAGLRASEAVSLKVADIDSSRMLIQVRHGKGAKDRTVMLSPQLLAILRTYWRLARPREWLFPGRDESKPIDVQVLHAACRSATKAAGLAKRVTVHTLRQLCYPSARERRRHPHHPGAFGPQQPVDDGPLYASGDDHHCQDAEPDRPPGPGGGAAGLSARHAHGLGGGGHLPPSWRRLPVRP